MNYTFLQLAMLLPATLLILVGALQMLPELQDWMRQKARRVLETAPRTGAGYGVAFVHSWAAESRLVAADFAASGRPDVACAFALAHLGFTAAGSMLEGRMRQEALPAQLRKLAADLERQQPRWTS